MPAKKGVGHPYNRDFLNVVFAASSLFLFLSVVWMVWDDFDRDWKNTQRRAAELQYEPAQAQCQQASRAVDRNKLQQLESQLAAAKKSIESNQKKVDELQAKLDEVNNRLYRQTQAYQFAKANYDHDKYDYESARVAQLGSAERKGQNVAEAVKQLTELNLQVEATTAEGAG